MAYKLGVALDAPRLGALGRSESEHRTVEEAPRGVEGGGKRHVRVSEAAVHARRVDREEEVHARLGDSHLLVDAVQQVRALEVGRRRVGAGCKQAWARAGKGIGTGTGCPHRDGAGLWHVVR